MDFLEPWIEVTSDAPGLQRQLAAELGNHHSLTGREMRAVARRQDCDDVLFISIDEPRVVAVVHLTWVSRPGTDPKWTWTIFFDSLDDWIVRGMKADHEGLVE